jgi:hypothetical protein
MNPKYTIGTPMSSRYGCVARTILNVLIDIIHENKIINNSFLFSRRAYFIVFRRLAHRFFDGSFALCICGSTMVRITGIAAETRIAFMINVLLNQNEAATIPPITAPIACE